MNGTSPGEPRPPRKDLREAAREKARLQLKAAQKKEQRRQWAWRGGITVVLVAIVAVIALVIVNNAAPGSSSGPLNMASDGILFTGDGTTVSVVATPALTANEKPIATPESAPANTVNIVTYVDYLCPYCGQFESTNGPQISSWLTAGNATLEVHPISLLDSGSLGTKYSTRAANAAACVANFEPAKFLDVNTALFTNQPKEDSTGLTNAQLTTLVTDAGARDSSIPDCISNGTFTDWVASATTRALNGPLPNTSVPKVEGTPTVLVNGVKYTGALDDAAAFQAFVTQQASAATGSGSG
ncbi:DsbA family protein [Glaciibacter psychrotolerans]|uniref:Protein-disulfide isomerase n=1 Tax=Glaciibacter psychrotolerans TaxID=670054 RepID=A0A7Z0EF71_9MICO|nr:thioredoxin domain-containing protein [Leifsonia psychrotolerans]NYJ20538.1 protein-disulfide isomerase [Leifsonia psychrotolerans]